MLKATPPAPGAGARVLVPGEIELANERHNTALGIELGTPIEAQLARLGDELGIPFPAPLARTAVSESASS
jgi:hypothetical protein